VEVIRRMGIVWAHGAACDGGLVETGELEWRLSWAVRLLGPALRKFGSFNTITRVVPERTGKPTLCLDLDVHAPWGVVWASCGLVTTTTAVAILFLNSQCGRLVQLLGGFWPPEAEAETKRPASRASSGRSAWVRSRPPTVLAKRRSFGFREKPTRKARVPATLLRRREANGEPSVRTERIAAGVRRFRSSPTIAPASS
jgi:hypothetical protein